MHDPADLEQRVQVAGHLGGRGQLPQQPVRLQVDHVPGMDDRGFHRSLRVVELHTARVRCDILFFEEQKGRIPRGDLVSVFSHCSSTPAPFTRVPLRLSRSRTRNFPSRQLSKQCFRETEGSVIAIPFDASRPIVISSSDSGIVESFRGPESTSSLGRKLLHLAPLLITLPPQIPSPTQLVPLSEQIGLLSGRIAKSGPMWDQPTPRYTWIQGINALPRITWTFLTEPPPTGIPHA